MISPRQRHPYRHFSLSAISPCIIRNQTDIDRFVGLSYLAYNVSFHDTSSTRRAVPSNATIGLPSMIIFSGSTGYRQVSAHYLSYVRLLYPYFPNNIPTGHVYHYLVTDFFANGFASSNFTGISITHSTQSPFFQMRFTSAYVFAFQVPCTGSPFTFKVAFSHQSGTRRNKENAFF